MRKRRKRAILRITEEFLGCLTTNGEIHIKVKDGLPKDAKFCGCYFDHLTNYFNLVYESRNFAPVPEGERMPLLPSPTVTDIRLRATMWKKLCGKLVKFYFFLAGICWAIAIGASVKFFFQMKLEKKIKFFKLFFLLYTPKQSLTIVFLDRIVLFCNFSTLLLFGFIIDEGRGGYRIYDIFKLQKLLFDDGYLYSLHIFDSTIFCNKIKVY